MPSTKKPTHADILTYARKMRQAPTEPEKRVWAKLCGKQLNGYKFRRQHPLGRFILDFYCHKAKLAIELDGKSHADQAEYDAYRTEIIEAQGIQVIRFSNWDVMTNLEGVLIRILEICEKGSALTQ
ncbi:MAG: endonuclease domain-containing protein [Candidatus Promineifilaceae bacterium]